MNNRRKSHRTKEERERASESSRKGWVTKRINGTDKWGDREEEPHRVPFGQFLGTLQWHGIDGEVKRLRVSQGKRSNSIRVADMDRDMGFDELFAKMRQVLSRKKVMPERQRLTDDRCQGIYPS